MELLNAKLVNQVGTVKEEHWHPERILHLHSLVQKKKNKSLARFPYVCTSPNILSNWKKKVATKRNSTNFDGVGTTLFVRLI
jgi:hypothetical protein